MSIVLVLLSQHLTWDCVGSSFISTIQGRYFIPIFPLLFISLNNSKLNHQNFVRLVVIVFTVIILLISVKILYERYYVIAEFDKINIYCDSEEISNNYFRTSNSKIFLEGGMTQSDRIARSGNYSAQLTSKWPFGYTYRFYNGNIGDKVEVEVWRFGDSGSIVFAGESGKKFYLATSEVVESEESGWNKLSFQYTFKSNMFGKEAAIYIFNNSNDTCYFDDLSIVISKSKSK